MSTRAMRLAGAEQMPLFAAAKECHSSRGGVPSLLKWTGSKRSQALRIATLAPDHDRYLEPFLGGGALLFIFGHPGAVAGHIYAPLVKFWTMVRDNHEHLVADYRRQWEMLQADLPDYFYVVRERFNNDRQPEDLNFLVRTCVNGIVRFSKKGDFNNSFHLSRRGMHPHRFGKIAEQWSKRVQGVDFRHGDFMDTTADVRKGDFLCLDPPYAGNKQRYIGDLDVERFYGFLDGLNRLDAKWALSFDGARGDRIYDHDIPREIYKRKESLASGYSAVSKVLNGPVETVTESLYLNY